MTTADINKSVHGKPTQNNSFLLNTYSLHLLNNVTKLKVKNLGLCVSEIINAP